MAELLDSDKANPADARTGMIFVCLAIAALLIFSMLANSPNHTNVGAGPMTGEQGLKVGVESATSHPQLVLPR